MEKSEAFVSIEASSPTPEQAIPLTLEVARARLTGKGGKRYWRSLEELADAPGFGEMLQREFPRQASEWIDPVSPPRISEDHGRVDGPWLAFPAAPSSPTSRFIPTSGSLKT